MDPLADKVIARCCIEMGQMHRYKQTTQTHTQPHIHPHFTHMWLSSDRRVLSGITHTHTHTHFTHLWLSSDRRVLSAITHTHTHTHTHSHTYTPTLHPPVVVLRQACPLSHQALQLLSDGLAHTRVVILQRAWLHAFLAT